MPTLKKVFISHSHNDHELAAAFRDAIRSIFSEVEVAFSSDKEAGGGPQAGTSWLDWIHRQVQDCQEALLLLTPYSIQKPWPMWEAGAVAGIAMQDESGDAAKTAPRGPSSKPVIPIRLNIPESALPGPFVVMQAFDGTRKDALKKLLGDLMRRHDFQQNNEVVIERVLTAEVSALHARIAAWQNQSPTIVTEGVITEWCARLDRLRDTRRSADVGYLHRWIRLLYEGPEPEGGDSKAWGASGESRWDIRLHLRLAENYELSGQATKAITQYRLAAQLAPLDVFVLHRLAKSLLDVGDLEQARAAITRIFELDQDALKWNAEVAGLEGRYWKDLARASEKANRTGEARERFARARDAYQAAMNIEGDLVSYYMADNVGQMSLKLCDPDAARAAYEKAVVALERVTPENENVWSLATRATAALVLRRKDDGLEYLRRIRALSAEDSQKASILRGLDLVRDGIGADFADYRSWVEALYGPERAAKVSGDGKVVGPERSVAVSAT